MEIFKQRVFNMPVKLRDKRRSLHITHSKLTELTKDAMRPKSWYLSSNGSVDIDPYTSVRKIFYEFPKKAFYGDNNESNGEIISNGHASVEASPVHKENEKNLRESFLKLNVKTPPSPVPPHKNYDNDNDNNNNITHNSASKFKRSYFGSKQSDSTSLKEESSSYADIYVPNATKTSNNFLRRGYKRRSLDPTKFKHLEDDDAYSITSARSSNSYLKKVFRRSYDPIKIQKLMAESGMSDSVFSSNGDLSVKSRDITNVTEKSSMFPEEQSEADNLIMERFLRDANVDICQGKNLKLQFKQ